MRSSCLFRLLSQLAGSWRLSALLLALRPAGRALGRRPLSAPMAPPRWLLRLPCLRVVLGIEVEDDRLPAQVGELDGLAAVALELEVRCWLALFDHVGPQITESGAGGRSAPGSKTPAWKYATSHESCRSSRRRWTRSRRHASSLRPSATARRSGARRPRPRRATCARSSTRPGAGRRPPSVSSPS